ncbi:hypothetical protein P8452_42836 [Trifolium repens]|nr:hypothetical protein P8452_42836 [Trifolium repens]
MGHSICPTIDMDKRTKPKPRSKKIDVAKKIVGVGSLKHLRFVHLFDDDGAIAFKTTVVKQQSTRRLVIKYRAQASAVLGSSSPRINQVADARTWPSHSRNMAPKPHTPSTIRLASQFPFISPCLGFFHLWLV